MNKRNDNDFWIFALPISGSSLVCQLAFLCEIYEVRKIMNGGKLSGKKSYCPDLCLGASGGSISAYIALAGGFTTEGIMRCSKILDPRSFSKEWIPRELSLIPNIAIAPFKGSLYDKGYGARILFERLFTEKSISEVEIWNSAFNEDKKSTQFFCNRYQKDSIINQCFFNDEQFLFDSLKLQYMNENVNLIADSVIASASIPLVVPNQKIKEEHYGDGGVSFPSALTVFANEIYRIILNENVNHKKSKLYFNKGEINEYTYKQWENEKTFENYTDGYNEEILDSTEKINKSHEKNLRLVYFFPYQSDRINMKKETVLEQDIDTINQILHFSMLKDRNISLNILNRLSKSVSNTYFPEMTTEKLACILQKINKYKHYVVWFEPHGSPKISLIKFTSEDIVNKIEYTRKNYSVNIWYSNELK